MAASPIILTGRPAARRSPQHRLEPFRPAADALDRTRPSEVDDAHHVRGGGRYLVVSGNLSPTRSARPITVCLTSLCMGCAITWFRLMRVSCGWGMSTSPTEQDGAAGQARPRQGTTRREAPGLTREAAA